MSASNQFMPMLPSLPSAQGTGGGGGLNYSSFNMPFPGSETGGVTPIRTASMPGGTSTPTRAPVPPPPGIVPNTNGPTGTNLGTPQYNSPGVGVHPYMPGTGAGAGGGPIIGGGPFSVENPMDPNLNRDFMNYLNSQVGKGVDPFGLSALLGSSGQATKPGTLTAPNNQLIQQLQALFSGRGSSAPGSGMLTGLAGGGAPGAFGGLQSLEQSGGLNDFMKQFAQGGAAGAGGKTLQDVAQNGIDVLPAWQSMVQAQQRGIDEGAANLKEQFNFSGGLAGTPFGTAMSDYASQTQKDQNALLGQMNLQGILQGQLPAAQQLVGEQQGAAEFGTGTSLQAGTTLGGAQAGTGQYLQGQDQQFSQLLQGLDQSSIQNLYNEFIRTQAQNNPLLGEQFAGSTTFAPVLNRSGANGTNGLMGAVIPAAASGIGAGAAASAGGAGTMAAILAGLAAV